MTKYLEFLELDFPFRIEMFREIETKNIQPVALLLKIILTINVQSQM